MNATVSSPGSATRLLIVAPAFNEEAGLPAFVSAAAALREDLQSSAELRMLIVDDGSSDRTRDVLAGLSRTHAWLGYVSLATNSGHQAALLAGLCHAGPWPDVIVTMDADLEHPLPVVRQLLDRWRTTPAVIVHAVRRPSRQLPIIKRAMSASFYRVTALLTGLDLAAGQADFRLWDANVLRSVASYLPHLGSLRVFAAWLPGAKESIEYDQQVRSQRQSRFTFRKNVDLAVSSIIRFSHRPLQAITLLGGVGLVFAVVYGAFIAVEAARGHTVPGWSSTVLTVMAMGCLQLIAIGVLASYFRRLVFARDLPPWIVRSASLDAVQPPSVPEARSIS